MTIEELSSRLEIQPGWTLQPLQDINLMLCGSAAGMLTTLAYAAVCSGLQHVTFVCNNVDKGLIQAIAGQVSGHTGPFSFFPVYTSTGMAKMAMRHNASECAWIIDAGDPRYDSINPPDGELALFYAECKDRRGTYLSFGSNRGSVKNNRRGQAVHNRAEIPALCSMLIMGLLATLKVSDEIESLSAASILPLPEIPDLAENLLFNPSTVLYAGGGGAIAHQCLWAESIDPVLKAANRNRHCIIVDPKTVHESCRSRQWLYEHESLFKSKAKYTAKWITSMFPGVRVSACNEKLNGTIFNNVNEALASIDNWSGRKILSSLCDEHQVPWWSAGSSFFGGFARQVDHRNPWCRSAWEGVERLSERPEDDSQVAGASCSAPQTPRPSSVLPQMIIGSWITCARRSLLLGQASSQALSMGIEIHITHDSSAAGYEGLRWSPGRKVNLKKGERQSPCKAQKAV